MDKLIIKILFCSLAIFGSHFLIAQSERPNVILILSDDQGWGATSVMMDKENAESASDFYHTPNLERLANRGIRFANGYAPHPNCSPSRASIQTGKSPGKLHFTDIIGRVGGKKNTVRKMILPKHVNGLPDEEITIAELIKIHRPEYATAHFGKWHIANGGPEKNGYDIGDGATGNHEGNTKDETNPKDIFGITERANSWMEDNVKKDKPFFLMLAHYATHLAMESRPETHSQYQLKKIGKRHNHIEHGAMTTDLDTGVGLVLDQVKALGIEDNTYIIYLSDNGSFPKLNPSNTNGPLKGWKATLWEGGIRAPFIIAGPSIEPNSQSNVRVVGYDLYPTIAALLEINDIPDGVEGGSLVPIFKNRNIIEVERPNDFLVFHWPRYVLNKGGLPSTVIYKGDYKLHKFYETGEFRLYNIKEDLTETTVLNKKYPKKVQELQNLMTNYLEEIDAGMPRQNPNYSIEKDAARKKHQAIIDEIMRRNN